MDNNTGNKRATVLTVTTKMFGITTSVSTNLLTDLFVLNTITYPLITELEIRKMSITDYNLRVAAFSEFVKNSFAGLVIDTSLSNKQDLESCPLL